MSNYYGSTMIVKVDGGRTVPASGIRAIVKEKIKLFLITSYGDTYDNMMSGANVRIHAQGLVDEESLRAMSIAVRSSLIQEFKFLTSVNVKQITDAPDGVTGLLIEYSFDDSEDSIIWSM